MSTKKKPNSSRSQGAEPQTAKHPSGLHSHTENLSPDEVRRLVNDLQVHQIELEMQNAELQQTQVELDEARERYFDLYDLAPVGYCSLDAEGHIIESNLTIAGLVTMPRQRLLNQPFYSFVFPEDLFIYSHWLKALSASTTPQSCELRMIRKADQVFWAQLVGTAIHDSDGVRFYRVDLNDIHERKQIQQQIAESEEKYRNLFENLITGFALHRIISDRTGQPIDYTFLEVNSAFEALFQLQRDQIAGRRISSVLPELLNESPLWLRICGNVALRSQPSHFVTHSDLLGKTLSVMVFSPAPGLFATLIEDITARMQAERDLVESRDELRQLSRRLESIREEERRGLARNLHDDLGQKLTAISIDLDRLRRSLPDIPPELDQIFESLKILVKESGSSVQQISSDLRPGILDDLGLVPAIEWFLSEQEHRSGLAIRFNNSLSEDPIHFECQVLLYRILQEAVTNVLRHAQASKIEVELEEKDSQIVMRVIDNGIGVPPGQISSNSSLGLIGMRERLLPLEGELSILGKENEGTVLQVTLPL